MMRLGEYNPLLSTLSSSSSSSSSLLNHLFILLILTVATIFTAGIMMLRNKKKHRRPLPPSPMALPIIGHLHLLSPLLQSLDALCSKYGPLLYLRFGSVPCVVVSNPDLAKKFLMTNELNFCTRTDSIVMTRLSYQNSSMAFSPYGGYWKTMRRISHNVLLGARSLDRFQSIRTKELHCLLHTIYTHSLSGNNTNITEELSKLSYNTISQMMLSVRDSGLDSVGDKARKLAREAFQIFGEFNPSNYIWLCKYIDFQGIRRRTEDIYNRYDALIEDVIHQHTEESRKKKEVKRSIPPSTTENNNGESIDDVKDFLSGLLDIMEKKEEENDSEFQITRAHIKALVLDFFIAGIENTAAAVEWCLAELINNPTILEKARLEIDSVVGITRMVQESDIKSLTYLQAIVKEALRLHPPVPMINRKSKEECEINGYRIPSQALVFVNIRAIGRDPNEWARPMDFDPGRFLGPNGNTNIDVSGHQFEFLPFGSGRRGCPGISLAMLEVQVTVAAMIQCFDWKVCCGGSRSNNNKVDLVEAPGSTARMVSQLVCMPTIRFDFSSLLDI